MKKNHYFWVRASFVSDTSDPAETLKEIVCAESDDGVLKGRTFTFTKKDVLREFVDDMGSGRYILFPVTVGSGTAEEIGDLTPTYDDAEFYDVD